VKKQASEKNSEIYGIERRVERQINEIEIQVKNIYKENSNEFNEIKIFKESMRVFEEKSIESIKETNDQMT
jgi:hypothetical protein|tara:strand:+ start:306 stop:518 length:213 start_codon:yes stop_codon:yes gene_type:complete